MDTTGIRRNSRTALSLVAAVSLAGPVHAEEQAQIEATPPPPDDATSQPAPRRQAAAVEELTVTAEKRAENIQDTPISITAFDTQMLTDRDITNVGQLSEFVPNLNIHTNAGGNTGLTIGIRGAITTDPIVTLEPAVGVYLNGVYIAKSAGALFDIIDLERVEVLRGPQGTLYGRNTMGGAVNLIVKKPSGEWGARTRLRIGNRGYVKIAQTFEAPVLGDGALWDEDRFGTLSAKLDIGYARQDTWYTNLNPDPATRGSDGYSDMNRLVIMPRILWELPWGITFDYVLDKHRVRELPSQFQLTYVQPGGLVDSLFGPQGLDDYIRTKRASGIGNNLFTDLQAGDEFKSDLDILGQAFTLSKDFSAVPGLGDVTLSSITGYRVVKNNDQTDLDGSPLSLNQFALSLRQSQISEELQLVGTTLDDQLDYVLGFYFFQQRGHAENVQAFLEPVPGTGPLSKNQQRADFDDYSFAPFGQATYTPPVLEDRLSVTAGLRWTWEKRNMTRMFQCLTADCGGTENFTAENSKSFDAFSPMGRVAYQFMDELMGYGSISRGFKAGGFNGRAVTRETFDAPFEPETATSYEMGFKSQWWDNRVQVNASGFFADYDDLQVTIFQATQGAAVTTVENAASAEVWGSELEAVFVPVDGLDVRLTYAYLDPKYQKFCRPGPPEANSDCGSGQINLADSAKFVIAPPNTVSLGVAYTFPETPLGVPYARVDWYWQDHVWFATIDNQHNRQQGYSLLAARLALLDVDVPADLGRMQVALWGENLTNTDYRSFGIDFGANQGYAGNTYGNPRMYGIELDWDWTAG